ncbi:MAG: hypothetical protein V8Q42_01875 [Anaerovoracaceae bacterium]
MIILVNKRNFLKILGTLAVTGVFAFVVITGAGYVREKSIDTSADGNWDFPSRTKVRRLQAMHRQGI